MLYQRLFKQNSSVLAGKEIRFTDLKSNTPVAYTPLGLTALFRDQQMFTDVNGIVAVDVKDETGFRATVYDTDGTVLAQEDVLPATYGALMDVTPCKLTDAVGVQTSVAALTVDMPATTDFTFKSVLGDGTLGVLASPVVGTEAAGTATIGRVGEVATVTGVAPGTTRVYVEGTIGPAPGVTARAYVDVTVVA